MAMKGTPHNTAYRLRERTKPSRKDIITMHAWCWIRLLEARRSYHNGYCHCFGEEPEPGGTWAKFYSC